MICRRGTPALLLLVSVSLIAACAPPPETRVQGGPVVRFVVVGDTHTIGTPVTGKGVYARIIDQVNQLRPDLLFHVGDMIVAPSYSAPVSQASSYKLFSSKAQPGKASVDTFLAYTDRLHPGIEFCPVLGNHEADFKGFRLAIETFPRFQERGWYSIDRNGAHFIIVENNSDTADSTNRGYRDCRPNGGLNTPGSAQRQWMEIDLRSRSDDTRWTFGFGHRAYYGAEGRAFRPNIIEARVGPDSFCELIESAGVDVFFNGDMHCYTRTAPIRAGKSTAAGERGTTYITCGGGGGRIYRSEVFPDTSGFSQGMYQAGTNSRHFFLFCEVYENVFRGQAIDTSGVVFDRWEIRKGK